MNPRPKNKNGKTKAHKLTKDEARAMRWLDETGTGDMAANLYSYDECKERLAMLQFTLAAEFEASKKEVAGDFMEVVDAAALLFTRNHAPKEHDGSGRKATCLCRWCVLGRALRKAGRSTKGDRDDGRPGFVEATTKPTTLDEHLNIATRLRCQLHKGHDGPHTILKPTGATYEPCGALAPKDVGVLPRRRVHRSPR